MTPPDPREALAEVLTDILRERFGLLIPSDNPAYVARAMVDPLLKSEALARLLATREAEALERAAAEAEERGDIGKPNGGVEAWVWLRARAQQLRTPAAARRARGERDCGHDAGPPLGLG